MFFFFFLNFSCNFVKFLVWYFSVHVPYVINELILSCNKMKEKIIKKLKKKNLPQNAKELPVLKGLCHPTRMREPMKTNLKKSARLFQVLSEILEDCFHLSKSQPSFDS